MKLAFRQHKSVLYPIRCLRCIAISSHRLKTVREHISGTRFPILPSMREPFAEWSTGLRGFPFATKKNTEVLFNFSREKVLDKLSSTPVYDHSMETMLHCTKGYEMWTKTLKKGRTNATDSDGTQHGHQRVLLMKSGGYIGVKTHADRQKTAKEIATMFPLTTITREVKAPCICFYMPAFRIVSINWRPK